ncbi:MAG TPA: hypothetical protein VFA24_07560 [Gaiellaceae bacterium]|nr:hypothetical protein [Gaiellaceae bacterium]
MNLPADARVVVFQRHRPEWSPATWEAIGEAFEIPFDGDVVAFKLAIAERIRSGLAAAERAGRLTAPLVRVPGFVVFVDGRARQRLVSPSRFAMLDAVTGDDRVP